ncbi:ROK family protein [Bacteroidetes/Chlorobi group bacterium ChocPot_Mid]|nr:MAG: ROK family protein [Bacteroidetes/Chlorobi group bacterium ChocPot_Mid]
MFIGIDIGGTNIKYGVVDNSGNILNQNSLENNQNIHPNIIFEKFKSIIPKLIEQFPSVQSMGIGVPGIIDKSGVLDVSPNLPLWKGFNIGNEFKKISHLTIAVDNDANAAAIAELELGNGTDLENFIYVTLGTGIGGAIIINKKIFKGTSGGAGEIGHTIINSEHKDNSLQPFRLGILEEFAGRNAIIKNYQSQVTLHHSGIQSENNLDVKDIAELAKYGSKPAIDCLNSIARLIGIGLASAMNLLDIPYVIIGGGISQAGDFFFDTIRTTIKERSLPTISYKFEVREAFFKQNTGIIGAAMLGANKLKAGNN